MSSKFKHITTEKIVELNEYIDPETGEVLERKDKQAAVLREKRTDLITIESDHFVVVDVEVIKVLMKVLNDADLAKVLKMGLTTTTPLNILTNTNNHFHTNSTLQDYLSIKSESMFMKLMRRLMKAGILYQLKGNVNGHVRVIYMMNPLLSRKRKTFDPELKKIFRSFDKEIKELKNG